MEERVDARKLIPKPSKPMMQARLTSLYGNNMAKPDNQHRPSVSNQNNASDECVIVKRSHGVGFGTKRPHAKSSNQTNHGEVKEDGVVNGFVSAKIKLEMDVRQKRGSIGAPNSSLSPQCENNALAKGYSTRSGAYLRRGYRGNSVPPVKSSGNNVGNTTSRIGRKTDDTLDDSTKTW